LQGQEKSSKL